MQDYPVLLTEQSVLILKGTKRLFAHSNHPMFSKIVDAVRGKRWNNIERYFDIRSSIENLYGLTVKDNNSILYKNKPVNNVVAKKIFEYLKNGYNHKPLARFLARLLTRNPSDDSINQLWNYLERWECPIDTDGTILFTKVVRNDWLDKFSKTISNRAGKVIKVKREDVSTRTDGDFCNHFGLYCGSLSGYVLNYGSGDDRVLTVRAKPENIIAVPQDHNFSKVRCCEYEVVNCLGKVEDLQNTDSVEFTHKSVKSKIKRDKYGRFA